MSDHRKLPCPLDLCYFHHASKHFTGECQRPDCEHKAYISSMPKGLISMHYHHYKHDEPANVEFDPEAFFQIHMQTWSNLLDEVTRQKFIKMEQKQIDKLTAVSKSPSTVDLLNEAFSRLQDVEIGETLAPRVGGVIDGPFLTAWALCAKELRAEGKIPASSVAAPKPPVDFCPQDQLRCINELDLRVEELTPEESNDANDDNCDVYDCFIADDLGRRLGCVITCPMVQGTSIIPMPNRAPVNAYWEKNVCPNMPTERDEACRKPIELGHNFCADCRNAMRKVRSDTQKAAALRAKDKKGDLVRADKTQSSVNTTFADIVNNTDAFTRPATEDEVPLNGKGAKPVVSSNPVNTTSGTIVDTRPLRPYSANAPDLKFDTGDRPEDGMLGSNMFSSDYCDQLLADKLKKRLGLPVVLPTVSFMTMEPSYRINPTSINEYFKGGICPNMPSDRDETCQERTDPSRFFCKRCRNAALTEFVWSK